MKILHVIPYFTPKRGGDVNSCYLLSKKLAMRGHDVTIITTDFEYDSVYAKTIEDTGVKVIPIHCAVNVALFLIAPSMRIWLNANLRKFDVIHMHDFRTYQNVIVHKYAKKFGVPYILQPRGDIPIILEKFFLKRLFDIVWGKDILENTSKVLAFTNTERSDCISIGIRESVIELVPNGIDLSNYNLPDKGAFRKRYGIDQNEKVVLYLGRIHKIKGIDLLVDAFAEALNERDDARLVIVGPDSGFLPEIKEKINSLKITDKVLITGPLYNKNKLEAYIDADVYILPSIYEAFPNTVLESWLCGTPVIVTNKCSISDIVDGAGIVVNHNKTELRQAIIKITNDDNLREQFVSEGRVRVKENFSLDHVILQIENVYSSIIKTPVKPLINI